MQLTLVDSPVVVNDFLAVLAEIEAQETFEIAYSKAVRAYNDMIRITGSADWSQIWGDYQRAFGVADGFHAPEPMSQQEASIPDDDLVEWLNATYNGINPF